MTSKKLLFLLLAISLSLVSCKVKKELITTKVVTVDHVTTPDITADDIHWYISILASDSLEGRGSSTTDEVRAAEYIKGRFEALGLKAFNGNYFQQVPITTKKYFNDCELYFDGYHGNYPSDFRPVIMFDSLTVAGDVAFAGYGLDSDYENLDVKGKWVMILEGKNSILFDRKATAKSRGASGVLVVGIDGTTGDERYALSKDSVPMIKISRDLADRLFARAGTKVSDVLSKAKAGENQDMTIPLVVHATVKSATQPVSSQNVVAYMETNIPNNDTEYIVIGAHYDHLGKRSVNGSEQIFHGADDNASGVAGLLEIAEKLHSAKNLKYNVLFAAFGAEEMGLFGSRYFCKNPPVPLEKIKLMINLDMIGRMDSVNHIYMNTIESNDRLNAKLDKIEKLHPDIHASLALDSYLQGSDHSSFYSRHIPAVSFTTGLHNAYHTPADTIGSINYPGEKRLLDFVYDFLLKEERN